MGRGRVSILKNSVRSLLKQHGAAGLELAHIELTFWEQDRSKLLKLLWNMRIAGEARSENTDIKGAPRWYYVDDTSATRSRDYSRDYNRDARRLRLARAADQANPLRLFGAQLPGGRCASVWQYAQQLQEHRA